MGFLVGGWERAYMKSVYSKWIANGTKKPGKSKAGLARYLTKALKLKPPMVRGTPGKMIAGTRKVFGEELEHIAAYIEEPIPVLAPVGELLTLKIERELAAGVWVEPDSHKDLGDVVTPRDFVYPTAEHHAYCLRGNSMVDAGLFDGDILICIEPNGDRVVEGKFVVIERERAGLIETSARIVHFFKDRTEYVCAPNSEKYKPVIVRNGGKRSPNSEIVRTVAIIRRQTRDLA